MEGITDIYDDAFPENINCWLFQYFLSKSFAWWECQLYDENYISSLLWPWKWVITIIHFQGQEWSYNRKLYFFFFHLWMWTVSKVCFCCEANAHWWMLSRVGVCAWWTLVFKVTSPDRLTGMLQVDKKVITAIAEGKADPDARLLKVGNSVNYTDIISTLLHDNFCH